MEKETSLPLLNKALLSISLALATSIVIMWALKDNVDNPHHKTKINTPKVEIENFTLTAISSPVDGYISVLIKNNNGNEFDYCEFHPSKNGEFGDINGNSYGTTVFCNTIKGETVEIKLGNGILLHEFTKGNNGKDTIVKQEIPDMKNLFNIK